MFYYDQHMCVPENFDFILSNLNIKKNFTNFFLSISKCGHWCCHFSFYFLHWKEFQCFVAHNDVHNGQNPRNFQKKIKQTENKSAIFLPHSMRWFSMWNGIKKSVRQRKNGITSTFTGTYYATIQTILYMRNLMVKYRVNWLLKLYKNKMYVFIENGNNGVQRLPVFIQMKICAE